MQLSKFHNITRPTILKVKVMNQEGALKSDIAEPA